MLYSLVHRDSPQWDTVISITNGVSGIIKISPGEHKLPFFHEFRSNKNKLIQQEFRIKMKLSFLYPSKGNRLKERNANTTLLMEETLQQLVVYIRLPPTFDVFYTSNQWLALASGLTIHRFFGFPPASEV